MYRLQLLNICSRETKRLPVAEIAKLLRCNPAPPIELRGPISSLVPSDKFVLYRFDHGEIGVPYPRYALVYVGETEEFVLDFGRASAITLSGHGYQHFQGTSERLGMKFEFYCPYKKTRGRLKTWST